MHFHLISNGSPPLESLHSFHPMHPRAVSTEHDSVLILHRKSFHFADV